MICSTHTNDVSPAWGEKQMVWSPYSIGNTTGGQIKPKREEPDEVQHAYGHLKYQSGKGEPEAA